MRLIDADALKVALRFAESHMIHGESEWLKGYVEGLRAAIAAVKDCATIEAEPVVRCKDCKWYSWCSYHDRMRWKDNDFCSRGERK